MKREKTRTWIIVLALLLLSLMISVSGCRPAEWYMNKAIAKGIKIDTTTKVRTDTLLVEPGSGFDDTFGFEIVRDTVHDTTYIKELCKEPLKKSNLRKFRRQICPEVDTTLYVNISYRDTTFQMPVDLLVENGTIKLETTSLKIGVLSESKTDLTFVPPVAGHSWQTLTLCSLMAAVVGLGAGLVLGSRAVRGRV